MANARMFLVNTRTGTRIYLAKYYPSTGWYCPDGVVDRLDVGFDSADFGHLTPEEREQQAKKLGFGPPYSGGGMNGDEWTIEYDY